MRENLYSGRVSDDPGYTETIDIGAGNLILNGQYSVHRIRGGLLTYRFGRAAENGDPLPSIEVNRPMVEAYARAGSKAAAAVLELNLP